MPGRKYNSAEYRYGFNGKEKDDEGEFGSITNYDYGFRIYNPAIGRFLSVDPLMKEYPTLTPYQFASNRPIDGIDLDGLEYFPRTIDDSKKELDIKLSIVFQNDGTTTAEERTNFTKGLEKLMREGMSGYLVDGSYLSVIPILTIVTSDEVDFNTDYHVEMVTSEHSNLNYYDPIKNKNRTAGGIAFSKKRSIVAYQDIMKYEEDGFTLPNGDVQEPRIVEDILVLPFVESIALHEIAHMLEVAHAFPMYLDRTKSKGTWNKVSPIVLPAPKDVRDLWNKAMSGDADAIEKLSNLSMNYPQKSDDSHPIPKEAGRKDGAKDFTPGQRTQIWNSAVRDKESREEGPK